MPERGRRGQTEPLGAIVAVVAVIFALTLYAGFVMGALPGTTDRAVEGPTMERVWADLGENGVYHASDRSATDLRPESAPDGRSVLVVITTIDDDGEQIVVSEYHFVAGEDRWREGSIDGPADARVATRPISVEREGRRGEVRGGTLRVEVWS